jgi:hypothetical protein
MPTPKKTAKPFTPAKAVTSDPDMQSLEKPWRIEIADIKSRDFERGQDASARLDAVLPPIEGWVIAGKKSRASTSKGGKGRAQQRKDDAKDSADAIRTAATRLLASGTEPRYISGKLMREYYVSRTTILRALRSHRSGHWPTRKKK